MKPAPTVRSSTSASKAKPCPGLLTRLKPAPTVRSSTSASKAKPCPDLLTRLKPVPTARSSTSTLDAPAGGRSDSRHRPAASTKSTARPTKAPHARNLSDFIPSPPSPGRTRIQISARKGVSSGRNRASGVMLGPGVATQPALTGKGRAFGGCKRNPPSARPVPRVLWLFFGPMEPQPRKRDSPSCDGTCILAPQALAVNPCAGLLVRDHKRGGTCPRALMGRTRCSSLGRRAGARGKFARIVLTRHRLLCILCRWRRWEPGWFRRHRDRSPQGTRGVG